MTAGSTADDQRTMTKTDLLPSPEAVSTLIEQFEGELRAVKSTRDAQAIRDRYLGRKNSFVSSWMQSIASAPPDQKKHIGRYANDLKQAVEARWALYVEQAQADAQPDGAEIGRASCR